MFILLLGKLWDNLRATSTTTSLPSGPLQKKGFSDKWPPFTSMQNTTFHSKTSTLRKEAIVKIHTCHQWLLNVAPIKRQGPSTYPGHLSRWSSSLWNMLIIFPSCYDHQNHNPSTPRAHHKTAHSHLGSQHHAVRGTWDCLSHRPTYFSVLPCVSALWGTGCLRSVINNEEPLVRNNTSWKQVLYMAHD